MAAPAGFRTCPRCRHIFDPQAFDLPDGGRSRYCLHCRAPEGLEDFQPCANCFRAKPPSAFRRRDGGMASWCGDCRVGIGRLEGRGHEVEDVAEGTPEGVMAKWLALRDALWGRKLKVGSEFGDLAALQLRLASEVLRDLENVFGPLDRLSRATHHLSR